MSLCSCCFVLWLVSRKCALSSLSSRLMLTVTHLNQSDVEVQAELFQLLDSHHTFFWQQSWMTLHYLASISLDSLICIIWIVWPWWLRTSTYMMEHMWKPPLFYHKLQHTVYVFFMCMPCVVCSHTCVRSCQDPPSLVAMVNSPWPTAYRCVCSCVVFISFLMTVHIARVMAWLSLSRPLHQDTSCVLTLCWLLSVFVHMNVVCAVFSCLPSPAEADVRVGEPWLRDLVGGGGPCPALFWHFAVRVSRQVSPSSFLFFTRTFTW